MGLTRDSQGIASMIALKDESLEETKGYDYAIALAGNPNTGKSTVFNSLTGLRQHTGNWPGKTVTQARGYYHFQGKEFMLVDLPGTYSLLANSPEEEVARDYICFAAPDATIIVVDATCLERNLNLAFQVLEITNKAVLCLNLMDEASRKGISINLVRLEEELGLPVVPTIAREGKGLDILKDTVLRIAQDKLVSPGNLLHYDELLEGQIDRVVSKLSQLQLPPQFNARWVALRLLDGDYTIIDKLNKYSQGHNLPGVS